MGWDGEAGGLVGWWLGTNLNRKNESNILIYFNFIAKRSSKPLPGVPSFSEPRHRANRTEEEEGRGQVAAVEHPITEP